MQNQIQLLKVITFTALVIVAAPALRGDDTKGLPSHGRLQTALKNVVAGGNNGGFGLNMWATIVNRDGIVCAVAFTGNDRGAQWPGSRVISAQKASTANSFTLNNLAL